VSAILDDDKSEENIRIIVAHQSFFLFFIKRFWPIKPLHKLSISRLTFDRLKYSENGQKRKNHARIELANE
jgi:hypothetical protein